MRYRWPRNDEAKTQKLALAILHRADKMIVRQSCRRHAANIAECRISVRAIAVIEDLCAELRGQALVGVRQMFDGVSTQCLYDADLSLFRRTRIRSEGATADRSADNGCGDCGRYRE